jgi:hypothetical protein
MLFTSHHSIAKHIATGFAVLLVLGLATEALAARPAQATGFWRIARGQVDLPLQFVLEAPGMEGHHSIHIAFPNPDPMISGTVSLVGMSPAALILPRNIVEGSYSAFLPLGGTDVVQITSMFTIVRGPAGLTTPTMSNASFTKSGGPGSFTFCPGGANVTGTMGTGTGPPAFSCPAAPGNLAQGMTSLGANGPPGRVVYMNATGFGGIAQILLGGGGLTTRPGASPNGFGQVPFFAAQEMFGGAAPTQYAVIGAGLIGTAGPTGKVDQNFLNGATFTVPKTAPMEGQGPASIITSLQFGPGVTSAGGFTACPTTGGGTATTFVSMGMDTVGLHAYDNIPLTGPVACVQGSGPLKTGDSGITTNTGFPFSAATVLAQQTFIDDPDFFTATGYDARNASGYGKIVLVAGGMALRTNSAGQQVGGSVDTISLTISKKTPSMSAGGFAAAAVLMVLAAGYAMRRRY